MTKPTTRQIHASGQSHAGERRCAPRAAERIPLALTESGTALQTDTKNISASGAYCTLSHFVAPMSKLQVAFEIPDGARPKKIRCTGVVVRIEPIVNHAMNALYHAAIFFTELAERDRAIIARFVNTKLSPATSTR